MGWFTAKDAPSTEPVRGKTISDKKWRDLQARAADANPLRMQSGSEESAKAGKRESENYRNRHRN